MAMLDDGLREPTRTEQIMIVTFREVIEGTLYHNENVRLSDALNSEANQHSRYVSLKDVTVYSISTGREIMRTAFLMVSHSHVIYMTPKGAVQMAATDTAQAQAVQHEAEAHAPSEQAARHQPNKQPTDPKTEFQWGPPGGTPAKPDAIRHAVIQGTDAHLMTRQAMLETLASIRGPGKSASHAPEDRDKADR